MQWLLLFTTSCQPESAYVAGHGLNVFFNTLTDKTANYENKAKGIANSNKTGNNNNFNKPKKTTPITVMTSTTIDNSAAPTNIIGLSKTSTKNQNKTFSNTSTASIIMSPTINSNMSFTCAIKT